LILNEANVNFKLPLCNTLAFDESLYDFYLSNQARNTVGTDCMKGIASTGNVTLEWTGYCKLSNELDG
jgi:hypothetical protein